jgi:hypothetical protein
MSFAIRTPIGVPTFLPPKIPAKELSKGFKLVFSPLRTAVWMGKRNGRYLCPKRDMKFTAIFAQFRAKKRAK